MIAILLLNRQTQGDISSHIIQVILMPKNEFGY